MKCNYIIKDSRRKCKKPVKLTSDQAKHFCWMHRSKIPEAPEFSRMTAESAGITEESDGITVESTGMTVDSVGLTADYDGITAESDGITEESDGITEESDGITEESDEMTEESDEMTEESDGITEESDEMTEESSVMTEESDGITEESDGESDGSSVGSAGSTWHDASAPAPVTLTERMMSVLTQILDEPNGVARTRPTGLGAKATVDECYLADLMWQTGFTPAPALEGGQAVPAGFYYVYRPNGTQQAPNFLVFQATEGGSMSRPLRVELKTANRYGIMLNDGFFQPDALYILVYNGREEAVVGLGQQLATVAERRAYNARRALIQKLNSRGKRTDNLTLYARSANTYHCGHFTDELRGLYLDNVAFFLEETCAAL